MVCRQEAREVALYRILSEEYLAYAAIELVEADDGLMTSGHHEDQGFPLVRDPGRASKYVQISIEPKLFVCVLTSLCGPIG